MAELTLATVGAYLSEGAGKLLALGPSNLGPDRLQKYFALRVTVSTVSSLTNTNSPNF
jgi:hypothetical protein